MQKKKKKKKKREKRKNEKIGNVLSKISSLL